MTTPQKIRALVLKSGIRREYFSWKLGIDYRTFGRWMQDNGTHIPLEQAAKLAKLLGCTLDELVGDDI